MKHLSFEINELAQINGNVKKFICAVNWRSQQLCTVYQRYYALRMPHTAYRLWSNVYIQTHTHNIFLLLDVIDQAWQFRPKFVIHVTRYAYNKPAHEIKNIISPAFVPVWRNSIFWNAPAAIDRLYPAMNVGRFCISYSALILACTENHFTINRQPTESFALIGIHK